MDLWWHFLASASIAAVLYPFLGPIALLAFVSGFLIDIDHLFYFVIKKKSLNPLKAYKFFKNISKNNKKQYQQCMRYLHFFEWLFILFVLSIKDIAFFVLAIAMLAHLLMDMIDDEHNFGFAKNYSLIAVIRRKF